MRERRDFDGLTTKIPALNETLDRASRLGEIRAKIEHPIVSDADSGLGTETA